MHGNFRRNLRQALWPIIKTIKTVPRFLLPAGLLLALLLSSGCKGREEQLNRHRRLLMDTDVELVFAAPEKESRRIGEEVFTEMERLEALFSRGLPDSDVSRINAAAGRQPVTVSPEVASVAAAALRYGALSGGAFDPTVAPVLDLWGFLSGSFRVPAGREIEEALPLVDYSLVEVNERENRVYLPLSGMALDLGGIAKGYIVDRGVAALAAAGVEHGFLNAGGDIGILGPRPDGTPWKIGVRHPRDSENLLAVIPLSEGAVVTSGDYERFFEEAGRRYHHILNPQTGYPAASLASVSIVAPTAMEADALSTAVFVLGPERGLELVESLDGVEALLVTSDLEIIISSGLQDRVELP